MTDASVVVVIRRSAPDGRGGPASTTTVNVRVTPDAADARRYGRGDAGRLKAGYA
jgi:hypothetical protein